MSTLREDRVLREYADVDIPSAGPVDFRRATRKPKRGRLTAPAEPAPGHHAPPAHHLPEPLEETVTGEPSPRLEPGNDISLVDDLADVLARMVVGWEPELGFDLAKHPDVVRVMARYRQERGKP